MVKSTMNTRIDTHPKKGRIVLANRRIPKGQMIECCPILIIPINEVPQRGTLDNYVFNWEKDKNCAIALGHGTLYSHSSNPNSEVTKSFTYNNIIFIANKTIELDEEITHDYLKDGIDKLWFEEEK